MNRNTLLVVDDVEVNRAISCLYLKNNIISLRRKWRTGALLLLNHQYKDSIAVLLLDIIMPVKRL